MFITIMMKRLACLAVLWYLGCDSKAHSNKAAYDHAKHDAEDTRVNESANTHIDGRGLIQETDEAHDGHENHEANEDHKSEEHHDNSGEGHVGVNEPDDHANHEEDDQGDHAGHDEGGLEVVLSDKGIELAELVLDTVRTRNISKRIELPGEVGFNADRVAHVVPRFPGIVNKAYKKLGAYVKAGETLACIESNESLSEYFVKARISGRIIEKHATLGEFVSSESPIYVIADLTSVWVSLAVYAKDALHIRVGQKAVIEAIGYDQKVTGHISYLSNIYNEQTRNMTARVVIPNRKDLWKPGTFVRGLVTLRSERSVMAVSEQAIQIIDEKFCVFVPVKGEVNSFKPVEVKVGERDGINARVFSGLNLGDVYVSNGAFELKSKIITSSLGDHAGHGH